MLNMKNGFKGIRKNLTVNQYKLSKRQTNCFNKILKNSKKVKKKLII